MSANSLAQTRVGWRKGRLDGRTSLLFRQALGRPWNPPTIEGLFRTTLRSLPPTNKSASGSRRNFWDCPAGNVLLPWWARQPLRWACGYPTTPFSLGRFPKNPRELPESVLQPQRGNRPTVFLRRLGSQDCRVPHRASRGWCCSQVCPRSFAPGRVPFFFGCTVLLTGP